MLRRLDDEDLEGRQRRPRSELHRPREGLLTPFLLIPALILIKNYILNLIISLGDLYDSVEP